MNIKALLAVIGIVAGLSTGIAGAQVVGTPAPFAPGHHLRGERGSARNLLSERRRIEGVIDQLQRDQHDFGGYREKAIDDLQKARADIQAAIDYDATHPGQ